MAKIQLKSCWDHTLAELLDNLRKIASIDDLPFQHGTPLTPERETGSGGTELADYESDLESYSPERLVSVINQQGGGAPSHHDPNETADQISEGNLTKTLRKMRMKLLAQLAGQEINVKENAGFELPSELAFPRATSTMNSTTSRIQSSEPQSPR